jgi:hypothetical protein
VTSHMILPAVAAASLHIFLINIIPNFLEIYFNDKYYFYFYKYYFLEFFILILFLYTEIFSICDSLLRELQGPFRKWLCID